MSSEPKKACELSREEAELYLEMLVNQYRAAGRFEEFEDFLLKTVAEEYCELEDWLEDKGMSDTSDASIISGILADVSTFQQVPGVGGKEKFYPLAEYGWDGGNSISTLTMGLDELVATDTFSGPFATIVRRTEPDILGIAYHDYAGDESRQIDFF